MPELPEVESFRKIAEQVGKGRVITRAAAAEDRIVVEGLAPKTLTKKLQGRTIVAAGRRGKQLWLELDERPWPQFHFGMTGSFVALDRGEPPPRFTKVELTFDDGRRLAFVNKRRLGRVRLLHDPPSEPPVSALGFDALLDPPSAAELTLLLGRRKGPIKALLLDQRVFAGVGNWIADEVLYQAQIAPRRPARDLSPAEVAKLRTTLLRVIKKAASVDADADRFPRSWLFHVRWGKADRARTTKGEAVAFDVVGGRTTAWVPTVQV